MKKFLTLLLLSSLVILASCGKKEVVEESEVIDTPVLEEVVTEEPKVEEVAKEVKTEEELNEVLTDEELNKELEEIFDVK